MWNSLYLRAGDAADVQPVVSALLDILNQHGYQPYDPFPGGMGTPPACKSFVKLFVAPLEAAPPISGWVRILGDPDEAILPDLSAGRTLLHAWLSADDGGIDVYQDGTRTRATPSGAAASGAIPSGTTGRPANAAAPAQNIIPGEFADMARDHHVNPAQANKLIDRLTSQLFGKMDRASDGEASTMQNQARALLSGANRPDWSSPAARRLMDLAAELGLPPNWREPDFAAVRDAYQAARMLRRNPRSQLMADEQAALKAIPNALDYIPVYVGK